MITFLLNHFLKAKGSYRVKENRIYRDLSFGFSYCCYQGNDAHRIGHQLNQLRNNK